MIIIREETNKDINAVRDLTIAAFGQQNEADLIDTLRSKAEHYVSLVAEQNKQVIGHILFTPVTLTENPAGISIAGLAPMAVSPEWQKSGIGSQLVDTGLLACIEAGYKAVVVLGHPAFYPKFGFKPSVGFSIKSEYEVPDEVFMAKELIPGSLSGASGVIAYHSAFNQV